MKISDLLRKVADQIDVKNDSDINLNKLNVRDQENTDDLTDAMVPPLQQELELKKRSMGMNNAIDRGQFGEDSDELAIIRKLTGL